MTRKTKAHIILEASVFLIFLLLGIFAGLHHEPWSDEAQSWLIARDNNTLIDILKAVRYEGTLPTWSLINKLFQICGLKYDYIFVIPLLFTAAGVILLFMSDAPEIVKVLLPFSFYTIFQSAVVARQYSMVFPAMMLILMFYEKRQSSPVKHFISLLFLGLTSSYGIMISCSFMLWDFLCMFGKKTASSYDKKFKVCFYITGAMFAGMSLASFPPSDISFVSINTSFIPSFTTTALFYIDNTVLQYIITILVIVSLCYYFRHKLFQFLTIFLPVTLYMAFFYHRLWHTCYLFYLAVILMILLGDKQEEKEVKDKKVKTKALNVTFCGLLAIQCVAGLYSVYIDYVNPYSPAKSAAEFIKPYIVSGASIDMYGYNAFGVQPYFDSNIFANYHSDKSYYVWSSKNSLLKLSTPASDLIISFSKPDDPEMSDYKDEIKYYKAYRFESNMIYKFNPAETNNFYILVKEGVEPK